MTAFNYTTGNPSNLTGGAGASMNDIAGPFTDLRTFLNGGNIGSGNIATGGVGTTELAANAVTAAKMEAQQAWQTLSLSGTGLSVTLSYFKDSLGMVHCRGDEFTTSANIPNGTVMGTLPPGYRPGTVTQDFPLGRGNSGSTAAVTITTAGVIAIGGMAGAGAGATLSLGAVHFRAEN
jgi:hypothetical protein